MLRHPMERTRILWMVSTPVKVFPGTHDKLGSYAARLANHETKEDEEVAREQPVMARPVMDDEHRLIRHYAKSLTDEPELTSPSTTQIARDLDRQEKRDLEDLIMSLENNNRALQGEDKQHSLSTAPESKGTQCDPCGGPGQRGLFTTAEGTPGGTRGGARGA
ncbi:hypothetical protein OS493_022178 [Desmophyllum pertusum]|uniref:Uncharacterized protein n=1 Tax=Desmophyllum pertusum TaxID=174260 RepID=A0A9W9YAN3_9CNID|nr:hypothetical protein OS493_022178 [Desmophyllum pertusum]